MHVARDLAHASGQHPADQAAQASERTGCEIYGKAEFMNPGQSVKDRAALYIIRDAIARGDLKPGGTIVEGTAGNTGIGLALVGASMGFQIRDRDPRDAIRKRKSRCCALLGPNLYRCPRLLTGTPTTLFAIPNVWPHSLAAPPTRA